MAFMFLVIILSIFVHNNVRYVCLIEYGNLFKFPAYLITIYIIKNYFMGSIWGVLSLSMVLLLFSMYMIYFALNLIMGIYHDYFKSCREMALGYKNTYRNHINLLPNDPFPFPGSSARFIRVQDNDYLSDMVRSYFTMSDLRFYADHYEIYHLNKEPFPICSVCISSFSEIDFYGQKLPGKEEILPSVYFTNCEHFFHRDCLWNWLKDTDYEGPCPNCRELQRWDFTTSLFDPHYINNNFFWISMYLYAQCNNKDPCTKIYNIIKFQSSKVCIIFVHFDQWNHIYTQ